MAWLDWLTDLLGSREWLLVMMIAIVAGAFMLPDYRISENDKKDRDERD
jgi:hypothetical protein